MLQGVRNSDPATGPQDIPGGGFNVPPISHLPLIAKVSLVLAKHFALPVIHEAQMKNPAKSAHPAWASVRGNATMLRTNRPIMIRRDMTPPFVSRVRYLPCLTSVRPRMRFTA